MDNFNETDQIMIQSAYDRLMSMWDTTNASWFLDARSYLFKLYLQEWLSDKWRDVIWEMIWAQNNIWYNAIQWLKDIDKKVWVI